MAPMEFLGVGGLEPPCPHAGSAPEDGYLSRDHVVHLFLVVLRVEAADEGGRRVEELAEERGPAADLEEPTARHRAAHDAGGEGVEQLAHVHLVGARKGCAKHRCSVGYNTLTKICMQLVSGLIQPTDVMICVIERYMLEKIRICRVL